MAKRAGKGSSAANLVVGIVLVAAILVLVNVISAGTFVRLDLTEGKEFTVSSATRGILRDLEDLVTITMYISEELPPQLSTLRRQISDILDEYRSYGRGKVQIDFVDPAKDPELEQRLRTLGIPQITAQTLAKDQFQSVNIYLGMHISYLDKQEIIPVVQDTYTLEYELTSAILKVSLDKDYVVGVLTGPTEHDLNKDLTNLKTLIQQQFRVRTVALRDGESEVPPEIDLLIVAGPSRITDGVKYRIDQYLMRGGRIIFLMDEVRIPQDGGLQALPVHSGMQDLLAHYGVRVQKALVLDRLSETATFTSGFIRYTLPYPYWTKAVPDLLNSEHPITNRLESLTLPWVAPLELDVEIGPGDPIEKIREIQEAEQETREALAEKLGMEVPEEETDETESADEGELTTAREDSETEEREVAGAEDEEAKPRAIASVLARTSPQAWTVAGRYDLNPQQRFSPMAGEASSKILAVVLKGRFESFYNEHEVPVLHPDDGAEGAEGNEAGKIEAVPKETPIPESPETQIIVVGNAQFATDSFLAQFPANSVFLMNAIDWMTLGDKLIAIRSRGATERPLKAISDAGRSAIKMVCIAGAPLLVVIFGLIRFTTRRRTWSAKEIAAREA